jgi:hypothetical protein
MKTLRDCQSCLADDDIGTRLEKSSSRLLCFLALLALIGVGGCSASGPEPSFETAYSAIGPGQMIGGPRKSNSDVIIRTGGLMERRTRGLSGGAKRQTREGRLSGFFVLSGE